MKITIKKNDWSRVLASETSPEDVPLIYTNNWFYIRTRYLDKYSKEFRNVYDFLFKSKEPDNYFIPLKYAIPKGSGKFRYLAIPHPANQLFFVEFYRKYESLILHYCSNDNFSIRRPSKVASSFYYPNSWENLRKVRTSGAESEADSGRYRHSTSYFTYSSYSKLHGFFESEDFYNLERKYLSFWSIDISKCFDSIYTHSIGWSTKNKVHSKLGDGDNSFARVFDRLLSSCNLKETNGVVIGSEISRIFAEVVLQGLDSKIEKKLNDKGLKNKYHYEIRRYVDDYFIFGLNDGVLVEVQAVIEAELRGYKLFINSEKTKKDNRPFITSISASKNAVSEAISDLFECLVCVNDEVSKPADFHLRNRLKFRRGFLSRVKAACLDDPEAYAVLSGYTISALLNKTLLLVEVSEVDADEYELYRDLFKIFLDIAFYLFNANPNTPNSMKLSTLIYAVFKFFDTRFINEASEIKLYISLLVKEFFEGSTVNKSIVHVKEYFPFEMINLLHVTKTMGNEYLLPPKKVKEYFGTVSDGSGLSDFDLEESSDYFRIMSMLFYIGNFSEYGEIKKELVKKLNRSFLNLSKIQTDARLCYLFLDSLSCPYIDMQYKKKWIKNFYQCFSNAPQFKLISEEQLTAALTGHEWFISWKSPDLWNTLEKKSIIYGYQ